MKEYRNLEEAMCKELEKLDKKYGGEVEEMSVQDAEKADLLYHALKSAATYSAMQESYNMGSGRSYRESSRDESYARGRDSMGRYSSRGMGGYSGEGYSGHYPEWMPPMYPRY